MTENLQQWLISEDGFSEETTTARENRLFCGNGYLGIRGSLQEFRKDRLPAINLSGIYDQVGNAWREPLNAPNALYTFIVVDGRRYQLPNVPATAHIHTLDFYNGIVRRHTEWTTEQGKITVDAEYFACYNRPHNICLRYAVMTDFPAMLELDTGIDGDVWDINGPHYAETEFGHSGNVYYIQATSQEKGETVATGQRVSIRPAATHEVLTDQNLLLQKYCVTTGPGEPVILEKQIAIVTSKDTIAPVDQMERLLEDAYSLGYQGLLAEQRAAWDRQWQHSRVEIGGDAEAERAINYSLYHLASIAPRHSKSQSIPARGLSGQTYKGAVFWDTEMFILEFFLDTNPEIARTLLQYRIDTLPGAQEKAKSYGYQGAFYAWESQEGGWDACSEYNVTDVFTGRPMRTFFRDKQIHISAAVAYGILRYVSATGDESLLLEGGAKTVIECARFYDSAIVKRVRSDRYELHDVIGPDEYHERVNNNGYTNRMAKYVWEEASRLLNRADIRQSLAESYTSRKMDELSSHFQDDANRIYIPACGENGIIPQFDGYCQLDDASLEQVRSHLLHPKEYWGGAYGVAAHTQIIKQADVVTWLALFPGDFTREQKWDNWRYYESRTEHGSSLSACMYGVLACNCGQPDRAYPFFEKSARADLDSGGKEWAGSVYIGGTHPAAAGGAYMMIVRGFAGITEKAGTLTAIPQMPSHWTMLRFHLQYHGEWYVFSADQSGYKLQLLTKDQS